MSGREALERAEASSSSLKGLEKKGLLTLAQVAAGADAARRTRTVDPNPFELYPEQRKAYDCIEEALVKGEFRPILLHGVTGSGKTEVYMQAIARARAMGLQSIYLIPEIALTPLALWRFTSRFDDVAVFHSALTDGERRRQWERVASGEASVVVGTRSAVFAPTRRLGLIVLDEEHDGSFKQSSSPRYHAREVAMERGRIWSVPVVLGSATPALETFGAARAGRLVTVNLPSRVEERALPQVHIVDLRHEREMFKRRGTLSDLLVHAIRERLARREQVILLLNRRGFSTQIACRKCGWIARCSDCDVPTAFHRAAGKLLCHYCGSAYAVPSACPECSDVRLVQRGRGTQKLEDEIARLFPDARTTRMDRDTITDRSLYEKILGAFADGEIDILLGTQMIAKGLDFPRVTLVGVVGADTGLALPDFRASERTFQLVSQVAGRAGRGPRGGMVIVQTFSPDALAIRAAASHDYEGFAKAELASRAQHGYPPGRSLVRILVTGPDAERLAGFCGKFAERLREALSGIEGLKLLGPAVAPIARIQGRYRRHFLIKYDPAHPSQDALRELLATSRPSGNIQLAVDVDPQEVI